MLYFVYSMKAAIKGGGGRRFDNCLRGRSGFNCRVAGKEMGEKTVVHTYGGLRHGLARCFLIICCHAWPKFINHAIGSGLAGYIMGRQICHQDNATSLLFFSL